jgi:putative ABC transport system permease protein
MAYVYIFSAVALFILLLATINYMNMATARSGNRAREVGMRKVSGAFRGQLVWQFMVESLLLAALALLIAVVLVVLLLNDFNQISGKMFEFSILLDPAVLMYTVMITVFVGLLAGTYPAFYLSSFQPVTVLKGSMGGSGKGSSLMRRTLVVVQFFIAIIMIIGTFTVSRQIRFLQDKDLGFDEENLVVMELQDSTFQSQASTFKEELLQSTDIKGVTVGTGVPGRINWIQVVRVEREDEMADIAMILAQVDYDFIDVMDIELAQGRNFDRNMGTDAQEAVLINETAAKQLGWESDPIGKKIQYGFDLEGDEGRILKVIGVMKDFHFNSLHNKIEPIIFFITEQFRFLVTARINGDRKKEALGFIGQKWSEFNPERPFDYTFLTDTFDEMYQSEKKLALIFRIATALTIFIALLGMLGLSSFIAERRTKEIGIRKVVGASMANIMRLLYREFVYLILIGFVLAVPVAWWRLDIWLRDTFIYFAPLSWVSFLVAGLVAFLIGFGTISFHIVRASASNPVDAIKYE